MKNNNQRELIIIERINYNITKIIFVIVLLIITFFSLFNNKTIIKELKEPKTKALDQEGQNYRLVTSADNVQVPVPKGYVASEVSGENYVTPEYSHTTNTYKVTSTELTWSSPEGETYPWTQDSNGIWISGNKGIPSSTSTLESEEFDYIKGTKLTINYTYSCQNSYNTDYLNIDLINLTNNITTRIVSYINGNTGTTFDYLTSNYTYTINNWATGRYKIRVTYSKNNSIDGGQDSSYIKPSTYFKEDENGTETIEEDIKTKIHDGGFVIYELTDEELANETNVVINDTNKDLAQTTRNQYVWVPVENIEDITRRKIANTGTLQFGQVYSFSSTSITKETNTGSDYFREPRLAEQYDKAKYYLQRYPYIDKRENYLNNQQEEFTRMIESINKYKGFYIGRYETGDDYTHSYSKGYFTNPRVVRYNNNIVDVTWYDSYKDLKRLAGNKEKYVKTGIIYDTLWDYTLKWLNETDTRSYEDIYSDSNTWGNYRYISFKYKSSANGTESTKNSGVQKRTTTGGITEITYKGKTYSNSPTASNNIFDIAGNAYEWTAGRIRSSSSYTDREIRGGGFMPVNNGIHQSSFVASGHYDDYPYRSYGYYGCRSLLCIN